MKKAFVLTGILFTFAIILLVSTNYYVYSSSQKANYLKMQIDSVNNRKIDVSRIINAAIADGHCDDLQNLLDNPLLDSNGVTTTITAINLTGCSSSPPAPEINVSIDSQNVHEELTYP